jgi:regulator of replication initiation timing
MSTTHPDRNNGHETDAPTLPTDAGQADLVTAVNELATELAELRAENEELRSENEQLRNEVAETREELAETKDQLADLEEHVTDTNDYAAQERAELASRVADLEESTDGSKEGGAGDDTPTPEIGEPGLHDTVHAVTPLEEAVNFPPRVAERELSENRLRGRFIARDPKQYCTNVQGGWMMTPSDMRTVISAYQGGGGVHPETLHRVREFLAEWGKDEVSIRQQEDGTNIVVFTDEIVNRLVKITGSDHEVVTGETAVPG